MSNYLVQQGHLDRPLKAFLVFLDPVTLVHIEIQPFQLQHRGCGINYALFKVAEHRFAGSER